MDSRVKDEFVGFMTQQKDMRMPKYEAVQVTAPDKVESMYPIRWPPYGNQDVQNRVKNVLEPLSLFAPYPHENAPEHKEIELERPVTPVDEEIKVQPTDYDQLAKYVRRRIVAKSDVPYLSADDQKSLAAVIMGEVNGIWPEIRRQIDDPFLSPSENKELNRRIAVHIVTVCEQLFQHFLRKAQILNERGIFSGPANMSRLKAQLALDTNKFLNILKIRRYIVADIRGKDDSDSDSEFHLQVAPKRPPGKPTSSAELTYKRLIQSSRPKSKMKKVKYKGLEHEVRELTSQMPSLDTSKLMDLVGDLAERDIGTPSSAGEREKPSNIRDIYSRLSGNSEEEASMKKIILKRSSSVPHLQHHETLMDELDIDASVRHDKLSKYELEFLKKEREKKVKVKSDDHRPEPGTREYALDDLKRLISKPDSMEKVEKEDEDLPPLLQAITRSAKHDGMKEKLDEELKRLDEKERKDLESQKIEIQKPKHPQPATVKSKLPNKMLVKTSDVRVSERVCMSSITLNRYATVYNELIEEVDPATIKSLDKNLFLGDEIKEVYKEIMKTVPLDHLDLDEDEMILPSAQDIDVAGSMASSTLNKRTQDRVINPNLLRDKGPPWGEMESKLWARTPQNPPKNFLGQDVFAPLTPDLNKIHEIMQNPNKMNNLLSSENVPNFVAEKMSRTYASWLSWWRGTITSDDYMKYLSTQETDYMGAVFHFYDSDVDSEDEDGYYPVTANKVPSRTTSHSRAAEQREKQKKMEELKTEKTSFVPGFWNANSVLMGGLGKDPKIEDEDDGKTSRTTKSAETVRSSRTLSHRAEQAKMSSIQTEEKSRDVSRASRLTGTTPARSQSEQSQETSKSAESDTEYIQQRLEKVWTALEMPDSLKLDMAIKYSCNQFYDKIHDAIEHWENATNLIMKREGFLLKLENFERNASDPNRFFEKGHKGSSVARLDEAKQRSYYYKQMESYDEEIKMELEYVKCNFQDVITFKGRPYTEKMKWDRVEMLYWLQEERKQHALKFEALNRQVQLKPAHLDPIPVVKQSSLDSVTFVR